MDSVLGPLCFLPSTGEAGWGGSSVWDSGWVLGNPGSPTLCTEWCLCSCQEYSCGHFSAKRVPRGLRSLLFLFEPSSLLPWAGDLQSVLLTRSPEALRRNVHRTPQYPWRASLGPRTGSAPQHGPSGSRLQLAALPAPFFFFFSFFSFLVVSSCDFNFSLRTV